MTYSAVVRWAVCAVVSCWYADFANRIVQMSDTASITGVATDATLRRLARVFARASIPGPRLSAASGSPSSHAKGSARSGPSSAAATMRIIVAAGASL